MIQIKELLYAKHQKKVKTFEIPQNCATFNELTVVFDGYLDYFVNGEHIELCKGDSIFINTGELSQRKSSTVISDYLSINFTSDEKVDLPRVLHNSTTNEVKLLTTAFDEMVQNDDQFAHEKVRYISQLLILALKSVRESQTGNPLVFAIADFLKANFRNKITLQDVAKRTAFSPIYCDIVFKKNRGKGIIDYLIDLRVDEAKKLIIEGVDDLQDVAALSGFSDYNYFSRTFKKRTGTTPTQYKKMLVRANI